MEKVSMKSIVDKTKSRAGYHPADKELFLEVHVELCEMFMGREPDHNDLSKLVSDVTRDLLNRFTPTRKDIFMLSALNEIS